MIKKGINLDEYYLMKNNANSIFDALAIGIIDYVKEIA
jgi:hypothetical protein